MRVGRMVVGQAMVWALATVLSLAGVAAGGDALEQGFVKPPDSAKAHTWWHWMNGNVTKEGITADLEAMNRVGVGGAQIFNVDCGIPPGPVPFMSPAWREMIQHAIKEAGRLGVELCVHNCAGWSSSGGPWNTPEHAMQIVVYSERQVKGPARFSDVLVQPPKRKDFYRDIAVLAFKTPAGEDVKMSDASPKVSASVSPFDGAKVVDGKNNTAVPLPLPERGKPQYVQIEFPKPFQARTCIVVPGPGMHDCHAELRTSQDGVKFEKLRSFSIPRGGAREVVMAFSEPVSARFYRLVLLSVGAKVKGMRLAEIRLSPALRIDNLDGKAAYTRSDNIQPAKVAPTPPDLAIQRAEIADLTGQMKADGHLTWDAPQGEWTLMRIGYTPTGKDNHPAPKEGCGLECDKLSREALTIHFDGMVRKIMDDRGPFGPRSLNNVLIDSYEVGCQNWTPLFREEFRKRRGYDLLPFLPVFSGRVVDSPAISERFLWDLRRTIAELFAENYSGRMAELCHQHGLRYSVEPYGNGPFDDMAYGSHADIPMGEFWTGGGASGSCKLAASIAHVYGRKFVGAESFTSSQENGRWQNYPAKIKALGDLQYCAGLNRFIFHRYAQQPWLIYYPGMTMGPWGFHFERTNTWWDLGAAWLQYVARCQYMLQEGLFVGDVCYFCGEGAPVGLRAGNPEMPKGYDYDGCNAGAVLDLMSVKDRRIALKSGMTYRLLVLPPDETMTPRLLRKLMKLVEDGATVVGQKPASSPSLQGYPACDDEVKALADRLWGDCDGVKVTERALGKGRIIWGKPLAEVLDAMGAKPDFEFADDTKRKKIVYIHRRVGETDVYFVSNQKNRDEEVECAFRVSGKVPELWHPETGRIEKAPVYAETDGRTTIPLRFDPAGSVFVVFREKANGADHAVAVKCSVARPPKPAHALEIRKAVYEATDGAGAKDVTDKLAALVKDGALLVEADNKTFGDPTPMHTKQLRVEYLLDGKAMVKTVKENGSLDIPEDVGAGAPTYELAVAGGMLELRAWCPGVYEITSASGKTVKVEVKAAQESLQVPGPWEVRFPPNWGAPERVTFDKLVSWSDRPEPGVKYFSGTATYVKKLNVPADLIGKDRRLHLDLGDVQVIADVQLNGKPLGILWTPPYRAEVTDLVKAGENDLEVKVVNLWPNRLIGDEQLPDDCEWTEGGAIKAWPQWLLEGKPRPGPRLTFTTWRHYTKDSPLLPSGLIGPVTLRVAEVRPVSLE